MRARLRAAGYGPDGLTARERVARRDADRGGSGGKRRVRTAAGARRYGVGIGDYIPEKGKGEVSRGQRGSRTEAAQDALVRLGLLSEGSGANKGRDGLFGPKTEAAIRDFQKRRGLKVTGKLDEDTEKRLIDAAPDGDDEDEFDRARRAEEDAGDEDHDGEPDGSKKKKKGKTDAEARKDERAKIARDHDRQLAARREEFDRAQNEAAMAAVGMLKGMSAQEVAAILERARAILAQTSTPDDPGGGKRAAAKVAKPSARPGSPKLSEDDVPAKARSGAKLVDFVSDGTGAAVYEDGSVFDGQGWQPGKPAR